MSAIITYKFSLHDSGADPVFTERDYSYTREFVGNCSLVSHGCKYGLLHSYQVHCGKRFHALYL